MRPGAENQLIVIEDLAGTANDLFVVTPDFDDRRLQAGFDALVGIPLERADKQAFTFQLTEQVFFR